MPPTTNPTTTPHPAGPTRTTPLELARNLETMRKRLHELWLRPDSADDRPEIDRQLRAVSEEIIRLISINIAAATPEYTGATAALRHANEQLTATLREGAAARNALEAAANAVQLLARVTALAA